MERDAPTPAARPRNLPMTAPRKTTTKKPVRATAAASPKTRAKSSSTPAATKKKSRGADDDTDDEPRSTKPGTPPRPDQMDQEVVAFINAIEEYKRHHQRPFPNWSEILEVVKALGYARK